MNGTALHPAVDDALDRQLDSVCRGHFAALVFSGARDALGDLPGETTASTPYKFALPDPRLEPEADFARTPDMPLAAWPGEQVRPVDGVCFVFGAPGRPALGALRAAGARPGEHFVVLDPSGTGAGADAGGAEATRRFLAFVQTAPPDEPVLLLGFGDQGARLAAVLVSEVGVEPDRVLVLDHGRESAERARALGFRTIDDTEADALAGGVIYAPWHHHRRLAARAAHAEAAGRPVFRNRPAGGEGAEAEHFRCRGGLGLEASADRALISDGFIVAPGGHGLDLTAAVMREDRRRLGGVVVRHLHGPQRIAMGPGSPAVDLSARWPGDGWHPGSFDGAHRAWLSIRDTPALGLFAGRALCAVQWPEATEQVMPGASLPALGATSLERLLLRHVGRCEIAMASQTASQQASLGVLSRHYAADAPIVEIGSALGGSALLMSAATEASRAPIFSIDPDTVTRDVMRFIFEREGRSGRLEQILAPSDEAIEVLGHLAGRAGLVHIDGLHHEAAVVRDYENYSNLVRPGGALVLHDASPGWYGVLRTVIERIIPDPRFVLRALVESLAVFERVEEGP